MSRRWAFASCADACSTSAIARARRSSALISESLAKLRFGNESPIGQRVTIGGGPGAAPYTIVGVVGDVKQASLAFAQTEAVYTTTTQWRWADNAISLVIRTRGDAVGAGSRRATGDLVGRQGSADRARRDDGAISSRNRRRSAASR